MWVRCLKHLTIRGISAHLLDGCHIFSVAISINFPNMTVEDTFNMNRDIKAQQSQDLLTYCLKMNCIQNIASYALESLQSISCFKC